MDIHDDRFYTFTGMKLLSCARYIFLLFLLMLSSSLWANDNVAKPLEKDGVVKLVATLQDSPAFRDVVWKLYRLDLPGRPVMTIKRHAAIVNLKPGKYRVVALLESIVRSRSFDLKSSETAEVIVPMDR